MGIDKPKVASSLVYLLCHINNLSEQDNNDDENLPNCKCGDVSYFPNLNQKLKLKCLSFSRLSIDIISIT